MTVIVAIEAGGKVYMGGDSYCGDADNLVDLCDVPKVFKIGPLGIGICGSIRTEQILTKTLTKELKKKKNKNIDRTWLEEVMNDVVRKALIKGGSVEEKLGRHFMPDGSTFLIALNGELYVFEDDFALWRSARGYGAAGLGETYAKGALHVLSKDARLSPHEKLLAALEAAANLSSYVRPPYTIIAV